MATEEMTEEAMKQEAFTLLAQGKRHLLVKDFTEASTSLALCCEYLARVFGETADECGDAYFAYGKALLELARTETGVLGNAIEEKDEADDGDSDDEDAAAGSAGDSVTEPEGPEDKATAAEEDGKDDDKSESVGSSEEAEATGKEAEKAEATGEEAEKAEATGKEAEKAEATGEEAEKAEATGEEAEKAEATGEEAEKAEATGKEAEKAEATGKEAEKAEATGKEAEKAEATGKEAEKAEAGKDEEGGGEKTDAATGVKAENSEPAAVASSSKENGHAETNADAAENGDGSDDDDDVSNLHLAWEVLELAKNVFTRRAESGAAEHRLRLAEVQLALGEVALESENYTDATADMALCLALQKQHLDDGDRRIAETLYQMGVAYSLANSFDDAISSFSECGHVLERRVAALKRRIEAGDVPPSDDPFYTFQGEVEQLEKLFPEIREKIFDMQDFKQETMRALAGGGDPGAGSSKGPGAATDRLGAGSSTNHGAGPVQGGSANDRPVSNIGHLVRKKAKPEAEPEAGPDAKRARVDQDGDK